MYSGAPTWLCRLQPSTPLPRLLRYSRALSCSDERDKIYGILGLCDKSHLLSNAVAELLPDYCRSVGELFVDIACLFIEHG